MTLAPIPGAQRRAVVMLVILLLALSSTARAHRAVGEPIVSGRFNPGVDNPDLTLDHSGSVISLNCGVAGTPSCGTAAGFYPSLAQYPVVSLEVATAIPDVEGHQRWNGGTYDDVIHGREWNSGPGAAAETLPIDRLGLSTTTADGVCPQFGYTRVAYPYLGTHTGGPWGHGGSFDCVLSHPAETDLGPEFTGPAINWLLTNYLAAGTPKDAAPLGQLLAQGVDLLGADADVRVAAVVYAYHLLSPASVRSGAAAVASTLPFGVPTSDFIAGPSVGNAVGARPDQIARIQLIGELLARQAMQSSRWGPYRAMLDWQGGAAPKSVGATGVMRAYIGGCGPSGPDGDLACAKTSAGVAPAAPVPDNGIYGTARPGATWNRSNGLGLVKFGAPTSNNGATITAVQNPACPSVEPGRTCGDGYALYSVTINKPGRDTLSIAADGLADWEPEMWASTVGQDAAFPNATLRSVSASLEFDLEVPVYVKVQKRADDRTIAVTGATFALFDAAGVLIDTVTTDASGRAVFGPVDTQLHPVPFSVRETVAPLGLQLMAKDQLVGEAPYAYSSDPAAPTEIVIDDAPVTAQLRVRKVLSDPSRQQADMSGFAFGVTRTVDHHGFGSLPTGPDGVTPAVALPLGIYDVCETALPPWAQAIAEVVGCQQIVIDGHGADVTFVFTNPIVRPEAATMLSTPVGGVGDAVVESLWTRHWQVEGRQVTVSVALFANAHGTRPADAVCDATTLATPPISATIDAGEAEQVTSLPPLTIPEIPDGDGPVGADFYAAGTIVDGATGALVATLPCGDVNERVVVPSITTTAPTVLSVGDQAHDSYRVAGLPLDLTWKAVGHFRLVSAESDRCDAPTTTIGSFDEPIAAEGAAETSGAVPVATAGSLHRFQQSMTVDVTRAPHPDGWTLDVANSAVSDRTDAVTVSYVTKPELCAVEESSPVPRIVTMVSETMLDVTVPEPAIDGADVSGFGTSSLDPTRWHVQLVIGVYRHDPATDPATWTCTADNLVGTHATITVGGDGHYLTDGIGDYPAGVALSSVAHLSGTRIRADGTIGSFSLELSGCQELSETQWVPSIATRAATMAPLAGSTNSDVAVVSGLPADFAGTITLTVYRFVPGGSVELSNACQSSMLGARLVYSFVGSGEHVSPEYAISDNEVAGVQYVHQETVTAGDGRVLATEHCAAAAEVATITRVQPHGRLVKTS